MKPSTTIEGWTKFLNSGKKNPKLKPPNPKLQNLISYLFEPQHDHVKLVDLCCGRMFGKSTGLIFIATMTLNLSPDELGLFLEPDKKRLTNVFLKKWKEIVNPKLYKHELGIQLITWVPTGARLYYGHRSIHSGAKVQEDAQLGQDATFIISDEESLKCNLNMFANNLGTLREPSEVRYYLTAATPRHGSYKRLVTSQTHKLFRGRSIDNTYLPPNTVDDMRSNMHRQQALRELDGEFAVAEGSLWPDASWEAWDPKRVNRECAWPNGNRHDTFRKFDPSQPWWLFCDLGSSTGSYVVVQKTDAIYRGQMLFRDPVWVAVADLCPIKDASAHRAFGKLQSMFGTPAAIVAGKDVNTKDRGDGHTVAFYARTVWGNIRIYPCSERSEDRQIQYDLMSFLVLSHGDGHRRFTIARDFVSLEPDSHRGVREMILEDAWPAQDDIREGDTLPKNKEILVQHTRDALLMGTRMVMNKPRHKITERRAG